MKIYRDLNEIDDDARGGALSIGKFDGLHLGHRKIIANLVARARRLRRPAVLFTFDPTPAQVIRPDQAPPALCDQQEKISLLERLGVDALVVYPTDKAFLRQTAKEFFQNAVVNRLQAAALVEGRNFVFGSDKVGDGASLRALCESAGVALEIVPPVELRSQSVSSSAIRLALAKGDLQSANAQLGRFYRLKGVVSRGDARGRTLGYPTANLAQVETVVPKPALYAALASLPDGSRKPAAVNIGGNPTFGVDALKIEAHILDFSGDLYGRPACLDLVEKIRDIQTFDSKDALIRQMDADIVQARRLCGQVDLPDA